MRLHIHRAHIATRICAVVLLVFSVFLIEKGITRSAPVISEDLGGEIGESEYLPGAENVLVGVFTVSVDEDTIVVNGPAYEIEDGVELTVVDPALRVITNASGEYEGDAVMVSADDILDIDDEILLPGTLNEFPASPTEDGWNAASAWYDQDADGVYDAGEDIVALSFNAESVTSGGAIRLFTDGEIAVTQGVSDPGFNIFVNETTGESVVPAIIKDFDNDGILSADDQVLQGGKGGIDPLNDDGVCFDGSISDDGEFDYTDSTTYEIIWWDADGTCATFDTGVDIVLAGESAPTGTSTEFGTEGEVGFIDLDNTGTYVCARGSECYEIVYMGVDGVNWSSDADFATTNKFFDASNLATDGLIAATNEWGSPGFNHLNTLSNLYDVAREGEAAFSYIDLNANTLFDVNEPILLIMDAGANAAAANGQVVRLMRDAGYKYLNLAPSAGFWPDREALFISADAVLDAGAIDGSGTDTLIHVGIEEPHFLIEAIGDLGGLEELYYYDHDASGSLAFGDDLIDHVLNSGLYNADDMLTIGFLPLNTESGFYDETTIDGLHVYTPSGESCAGAGTDTLIASHAGGDFAEQALPATVAPLLRSNNGESENKICVYVDISEDSYLGIGLEATLDGSSTQFSSGVLGADVLSSDGSVVIAGLVDASVGVSPGYTNQTNEVTFSVESIGRVGGAGRALALFPITLDVDGASIACTKNGVSIDGMSGVQEGFSLGGDEDPVYNAVGLVVTNWALEEGDTVVCTVSNFSGPESAGVYVEGAFYISAEDSQTAMYDLNISYTFIEESGDGARGDVPVIEPPDYGITLVSPNGGEVYKAGGTHSIAWTADPEVGFVNVAYSLDGGESYRDIVRGIVNTGSFLWRVPSVDSQEAVIRIQSTDLGAVLNHDESDEIFQIVDPAKPFITWRSPAANASLQAGTRQWLLWDSSPIITEVELALSTDGGATYPVGTGRVRNENAYQLQLPEENIEAAYLKITGHASGFLPVTVIAGPFSILSTVDESALRITAPNTLQAFIPGQKTMITWETEGDVPFVELQFASEGTVWVPISEFIANTGSFEWTVPDVESQYAFIRVGGRSAFGRFVNDKSDEPFWIVRTIAPAITITAPQAGTKFSVDSVASILWDSAGNVPSINLYVTFANGLKEVIALGTQNTNLYEWTIPELPFNTFSFLIEGLDGAGNVITQDTAGPFFLESILDIPCTIGIGSSCNPPVEENPCVLDALRPGGVGCESEPSGSATNPGRTESSGTATSDQGDGAPEVGNDTRGSGGTFIAPDAEPADGNSTVNLAIFDQTGLDLYQGSVTPRISVANETIELGPTDTIGAIIGTNVLIQLTAETGNFTYATSDGVTEPFERDASGILYAYVPIGSDTTHIKVQSQDLSPPFAMSLRVAPQSLGTITGLDERDGTERIVLLDGGTEWDASASGQTNPLRLAQNGTFAWYVPNGRYTVEVRSKGESVYAQSLTVRNNIVNPSIELAATQEELTRVNPLVDILIPDDVQDIVIDAVEQIRENETAQTIAVVAVPVSAVAVVTGATVLGTSFNLLSYLQYLFTSPIFLFSRKKKKEFGTVYNSLTKAPIPFATIRFYDKDNRIARTVVTDTSGHYTLSLPPGIYRPVVVKLGYLFPSEQVISNKDGELIDVYSSGYITVGIENPVVRAHFPLDPNQVAGRIVSLRRASVLRTIQYMIAFGGFALSAYATFINPSKTSLVLLGLQVVIVAVSVALTKVHAGPRIGQVIDMRGKPMAGVVVRLFEATYNKLIETQRTDVKGRYNFMAKDGQFYVVAETPRGKVTSQKIDYRGKGDLRAVAPVLKI